MPTYLALLRGINVGGNTRIAMADLRRLFADLGYADVQTHIQSGNVIFGTSEVEPVRIREAIEQGIAQELGLTVTVLLRTRDDLARIVANNPFEGRDLDPTRLVVAFLASTPDPEKAAAFTWAPGETGEFSIAGREVYLYYPNGQGRSKLNNSYLERRLGTAATARNWRVVNALHEKLSGAG